MPLFFSNNITELFNGNSTMITMAEQLCGDFVNNAECLFDFVVTNDTKIAIETKEFKENTTTEITDLSMS